MTAMSTIISCGFVLFLFISNPILSQVTKCKGSCSCPTGTEYIGQSCVLNCLGADVCKDGKISCRSGDSCIIKCIGDEACAGNTLLDGSEAADVKVRCGGGDSCKGNTVIKCGTGSCSVKCGKSSDCADARFDVSNAASFQCTGSCPSNAPAPFTAAPTAVPTTAAPSIAPCPGNQEVDSITGVCKCPLQSATGAWPWCYYPFVRDPVTCDCVSEPPLATPAPTALVPTETVICSEADCACSGAQPCTFQCNGPGSCQNKLLLCPRDFECNLDCAATGSCDGVLLVGPVGHDLTVLCNGESSCLNGRFLASESMAVSYSCGGVGSCSGTSTTLNCGLGHCNIMCLGAAACDTAVINPGNSSVFSCFGASASCPLAPPTTLQPTMPTMLPTVITMTGPSGPTIPTISQPIVTAPTIPGTITLPASATTGPCGGLPPCPCEFQHCFEERDLGLNCECSCPFEILLAEYQGYPDIDAAICGTALPQLSYVANSCACDCPLGSPQEADCAAFGMVRIDCECQFAIVETPALSPYCCHTAIPLFKPYAGRCWRHQDEASCGMEAETHIVCRWDTIECLANPPVNTLDDTKACEFKDEACVLDSDCCSEVCRSTGVCR